MEDLDLEKISSILENKLDVFNFKYISFFVGINLLIALINWLFQKNIKNAENKIYKKKVREDRRIDVVEELYKDLVSLTYILDPVDMSSKINEIALIERKLAESRLYINSGLNASITELIDYFKLVANDFGEKNFQSEENYLKEIKKQFDK